MNFSTNQDSDAEQQSTDFQFSSSEKVDVLRLRP